MLSKTCTYLGKKQCESYLHVILTGGCAGGVSIGRQKLRQQKVLNSSPLEMQFAGGGQVPSRAAAAAGQSGLMALYDSLFGMMDLQAAQVLVTRNDFTGMVEYQCLALLSMYNSA